MGTVHRLIEERGKAGALRANLDRRVVEAAAQYMADQEPGIGFAFNGWAQAALPHRRLPDSASWQIQSGDVTLMVQPGQRRLPSGKLEFVGVPYGSRARLIILYLQTEALRTRSREVALGPSLRAWMTQLGIPLGGKSIKDVRDQTERILRCRLTFEVNQQGCYGIIHQHIVDAAMFDSEDERQGIPMVDQVVLCESFFTRLMRSPVRIEKAAIRAINNNSMAIDIYCWLAHYLPQLVHDHILPWSRLQVQFGSRFQRPDHFRVRFLENLDLALAVYRDARIDIDSNGLLLRAARSAVGVDPEASVRTQHMPA
jgi:Plasmid encoded RepA protein